MTFLRIILAVVLSAVFAITSGFGASTNHGGSVSSRSTNSASTLAASASVVHHLEYVFPDQAMYVYDLDRLGVLVKKVSLPGVSGIRGVAASPRTHRLYVSFGPDSGPGGNGSMLSLDLLSDKILWTRSYSRGVDSMAIDAKGQRLYLPDGELSPDGVWTVIDAADGNVVGEIRGGAGPHNTVVGASGKSVYLGGRNFNYLDVASTRSLRVVRQVGPLISSVRPFTINGRETLAYTTATGFLGFQVSSLRTGHVLYTEQLPSRFAYDPAHFAPSAPSHGISLAPNERQLWVIDAPNDYVHVFDVSRVPGRAPRRLADLKLTHGLEGSEAGCQYDCLRDGWLQHSTDGCLLFVGDSGDVFSTARRKVIAFLPALRDTRKSLEIDWRGGMPVDTSSRTGLGRVRHAGHQRFPRCR